MLFKPFSGFCPYCHKDVAFSWVEISQNGGSTVTFFKECYGNRKGRWTIGECPNCEGCVLLHFNVDNYGKAYLTEVFPYPLPSPVDERIPENIRTDLVEAKLCLSVNAYRACVVMCRRSMQQTCITKGATKRDLIDQIDEIATNGTITSDLKDLAHMVRWVGNDAAHPNKDDVTEEDAKEILNLAEQFMQVVFVAPAKVKEIRDRKNKNGQTKV